MHRIFIGCSFRHGRDRRLAYQKSLPPLSPLARLTMFRQSVCDRRVAACGGKRSGVSSTCSTSTVLHRRLPDLLLVATGPGTQCVGGPSPLDIHAEVGRAGLRRTVEVELEFETPLNRPRNAATLGLQTVCRNIGRPANGLSGGSDF
ncbi:MAG TPA: hypothetical protein VHX86_00610 [Tepidisphaeraceae bacterium]|nr:hypothetical protein [Tepidisphaeraceae bacterium]